MSTVIFGHIFIMRILKTKYFLFIFISGKLTQKEHIQSSIVTALVLAYF